MAYSSREKRNAYIREYRAKKRKEAKASGEQYFEGTVAKKRWESNVKQEWVAKRRELSPEEFKQWSKDDRNRKKREQYAEGKTVIDNYKKSNPCHCGETDISCLEFHHRDKSTKKFAISAGKNEKIKILKEEMAKCDVLCKNCHTKLHNEDIIDIDYNKRVDELDIILATKLDKKERRRIYSKKQKTISKIYVRDYKIENNCKKCGEENPNCLVFHHQDPAKKEGNIPQLYKYGVKRVQREIDKCDLLCHNCHSKIHHIENHPLKHANI